MKYYLVIVNYNNCNVTIDCILSAGKLIEESFSKIVVVDNNSDGSDKEILRSFILNNVNLDIDLISLDRNMGYFPALNKGIVSLNLYGRDDFFLVVGNNDLLFPSDFIQSLKALIINEKTFVISPDIITPQGIHQNPHVINRLSFFRRFAYKLYFSSYPVACILTSLGKILGRNRREKSRFGYNKEQIIRMGFGACYIILPRYIQKLGLLDESVFLMGEEALLGNQVYSNGGEILYTPQVKVIHQDHSTFKKMPSIHTYNITKESYKVYKKLL